MLLGFSFGMINTIFRKILKVIEILRPILHIPMTNLFILPLKILQRPNFFLNNLFAANLILFFLIIFHDLLLDIFQALLNFLQRPVQTLLMQIICRVIIWAFEDSLSFGLFRTRLFRWDCWRLFNLFGCVCYHDWNFRFDV